MHFLILCILSSTGVFVVFKFLDKKNILPYPVILINYLVATILGFLLNSTELSLKSIISMPWLPISFLIGLLFIMLFFVIARSTKIVGISITTVASKMSVVFPIIFSMLIDKSDILTTIKLFAIIVALMGVMLTIYTPDSNAGLLKKITLPLILFIGLGLVDSLVKFSQHKYVDNQDSALFSAILFFIAFLSGIILLPFRRDAIPHFKKSTTWIWGLVLGIVNFGSIYLMIYALNYVGSDGTGSDSSVIFGLNNIGIVTLSVMAGILIFSEKLRAINWIGIALSLVAIVLFSIS